MINPYTRENPGNFANDRQRASEAGSKGGETTAERYLDEAREMNAKGESSGGSRSRGKSERDGGSSRGRGGRNR